MEVFKKEECLYLPPNGKQLQKVDVLPAITDGIVRVVSISDTHNQHHELNLPWGHILVHAGDILTESGVRYLDKNAREKSAKISTSYAPKLFNKFAKWLGTMPHPHKLVISGNHDGVLEVLGTVEVRRILANYCNESAVYLVHEEASVGGVKVFGSPVGHWGSHNDAFKTEEDIPYDISKDTHIVVTHYPYVLPRRDGSTKEDKSFMKILTNAGTKLYVAGHCHWAYGLYLSSSSIPCIVASNCDSHWVNPVELFIKAPTERGDKKGDRIRGGYFKTNLPIVCDIIVPGGPPPTNAQWIIKDCTANIKMCLNRKIDNLISKPTLLFFGPSNDPGTVKRLMPYLNDFYVDHFEDAEEAVVVLRQRQKPYDVCISKLGIKGNLGVTIMDEIRKLYGYKTTIIIHSATALKYPDTRKSLNDDYSIKLFVDHDNENDMLPVLKKILEDWNSMDTSTTE